MENKERFLSTYREHIHWGGSEELLDYLLSEHSDFFRAPASTRFHGAYAQGLLEHSLNACGCLEDYLSCPRVKECYHMGYNEETVVIVAPPHDICKTNCYRESTRNQKVNGQRVQVPFYEYEDQLPYGHGEKGVYIITGFIRLGREETFAIRYRMRFSGSEEIRNVGAAFGMHPPAFALGTADMEATYYPEGRQQAVTEKGRKQTKRSCSNCKRIKHHNRQAVCSLLYVRVRYASGQDL